MLIGHPFAPVVFDRAEQDDDITYARVTQVAADLMTGPGRGPAALVSPFCSCLPPHERLPIFR